MNPTPSGSAPSLGLSVAVDGNNVPTNQINALGVTYDNNGNQTGGFGGLSLTYDVANRVIAVGGSQSAAYAYDSDNRRIYSRNAGGAETIYFYGVDGKKLATYTYQIVTSASTGNVPEVQLTQQSENVYFLGKLIVAEGNLVQTDRLGSVRSGGPGGLGYQAQYPYGVEYSPQTANDREKYATYTRDSVTGLDYAMNRYYSSQWGRFLSPDPSGASVGPGNPGSWNRYAYVNGDPANHADPTGLFLTAEDCIGNPDACLAEDWGQPGDLWGGPAGPDGLPCGFLYGTACGIDPNEGCVVSSPGSPFAPLPPTPTPVPCASPQPDPDTEDQCHLEVRYSEIVIKGIATGRNHTMLVGLDDSTDESLGVIDGHATWSLTQLGGPGFSGPVYLPLLTPVYSANGIYNNANRLRPM